MLTANHSDQWAFSTLAFSGATLIIMLCLSPALFWIDH